MSDGLFTKPVNNEELKQLQRTVESGGHHVIPQTDPHMVAALVLEFFRELPDPLLPFNYYKNFISWREIDEPNYQLNALRSLTHSLPYNNRYPVVL